MEISETVTEFSDIKFDLYGNYSTMNSFQSPVRIIPLQIIQHFNGQQAVLHPVVFMHNQGVWLVDCGYEGSLPLIDRELKKHKLTVHDVNGILISHDDIDHVGGLYEFKAFNPGLKVYSSRIEAPYVSGQRKSKRLEQAEQMLEHLPDDHKPWAESFIQSLKSIQRVPVDFVLEDGNEWEGLQIIQTPGHTPGHISLYHAHEQTLIANDALVYENNLLDIANPQFALDLKEAVNSVIVISQLSIRTIHCYHGGSLSERISELLSDLISRYRALTYA